MNTMPFLIVPFHRSAAVIILTGGGDWGHGGLQLWEERDAECPSNIATTDPSAVVAPASCRLSRGRPALGRVRPDASRTSCAIIDSSAIIAIMASITIRGLDETIKRNLRIIAAINGRSMEEEAREILKAAVGEPADVSEEIRRLVAPPKKIVLRSISMEPLRRRIRPHKKSSGKS
jgi:antitoxin FitA